MVKIFKFQIAGDNASKTAEIERTINENCKNVKSITGNTYAAQKESNGFYVVYALYTVICD